MSTNAVFREDELVHRKVKVGNEWQVKTFPVVGGTLRLVHENNPSLRSVASGVATCGRIGVCVR